MFENSNQRKNRYNAAVAARTLVEGKLNSAYQLFSPLRNTFYRETDSENIFNTVFDPTGITSLQDFANNIQFVLMPPGRRWATLVSGHDVPEIDKQVVDEDLQKINKILFNQLASSNIDLAVNEAFKDMGISTGVILLQETPNDDSVFNFISIPPSTVAFEQNHRGKLTNFWRKFDIAGEEIRLKWDEKKLRIPGDIATKINDNPHEKITLIEGTIEYPLNKKKEQIFYYVQLCDGRDILTEWKEYNPWIGFRFDKSPIDVWGSGPGLATLSAMQTLNKMAAYELMGIKYQISPAWLVKDDGILNPYNLRITPDSIIPVKDVSSITSLKNGGNINFSQLVMNEYRQMIKTAFFSNPLTPDPTPNQSATEVSIRQNEWIRRSTSSFGRLTDELLRPIIEKSLKVLSLRGIIGEEIDVNNKNVSIKYQSPVAELQAKDDINRLEQFTQALVQFIPPEGLAAILEIPNIPPWLAERFGVDLTLVKTPQETRELIQEAQNQQQLQQEQLPQELPQPLTPQTDVINTGII